MAGHLLTDRFDQLVMGKRDASTHGDHRRVVRVCHSRQSDAGRVDEIVDDSVGRRIPKRRCFEHSSRCQVRECPIGECDRSVVFRILQSQQLAPLSRLPCKRLTSYDYCTHISVIYMFAMFRFLVRLTKRLSCQTARHPLVALFVVFSCLFAISIAVLWLAEPQVETLPEAILMVLPPFLGQVLENYDLPISIVLVWVVGLIANIGSLAIITALIVNRFLLICLQGGRVVRRTSESEHVVVCGWNSQGSGVVTELLKAENSHDIVILAQTERCPVAKDTVEFLSGDPTQDEDLRRAGVERADSVIVLTDFSSNPNEADARALLIALAVETLNPSVHSCVQILNSANRRHFLRAGVDELICLDQIGGNLAVASALNHGISVMVSELLTFNSGSEFYRITGKIVDSVVGMSFAQAVSILLRRKIILLGVEMDSTAEIREALSCDVLHAVRNDDNRDRVVVINPQGHYRIHASDALFCVAESV